MILFTVVWVLTLGKVSFWLLPNLTEDVGFFESFRPAYKCDFKDAPKGDGKETVDAGKKDEYAQLEGVSDEKLIGHADGEDTVDRGSEEENDEDKEKAEEEEEEEEGEGNEEELDCGKEVGHSGSNNENGYEIIDSEEMDELSQADEEESEDEAVIRRRKRHKRTKKTKMSPDGKKTQ